MKIHAEIIETELKQSFKIARDEEFSLKNESIKIILEHDGVTGFGEASPYEYYYGEDTDKVFNIVSKAGSILGDDPFLIEDIMDNLVKAFPHAPASIAGIDLALHDLVGKLVNLPLYRFFGLNPLNTPQTSYTIGIDSIPVMIEKIKEAAEYPILKIKVGVPNDLEMIAEIRKHTDAAIRVDANNGWTVDEAIKKINQLEKYNIELIEQPIPPKDFAGLKKIRENTNIKLMADEDSVTSADLPALVGCVDAINIKLMKCGGLREAMRMIRTAHTHGMEVMLGCMIESSLSISAAAHLTPLVEYADLDSNLLMSKDPFQGVEVKKGKLILPNRPGIGVIDRQ